MNISVRAELKHQDGLKRPSTPVCEDVAFKSRQPKSEDAPLKAPVSSQRYIPLENTDGLSCIVHENNPDFGRFDINAGSEGGPTAARPNTPSLNKGKRDLTHDELKGKLAKAIERRTENQAKRLRPITARKERFNRRRLALENAKVLDQQIQKNAGENKVDKAAQKKMQLQNEKIKVSQFTACYDVGFSYAFLQSRFFISDSISLLLLSKLYQQRITNCILFFSNLENS